MAKILVVDECQEQHIGMKGLLEGDRGEDNERHEVVFFDDPSAAIRAIKAGVLGKIKIDLLHMPEAKQVVKVAADHAAELGISNIFVHGSLSADDEEDLPECAEIYTAGRMSGREVSNLIASTEFPNPIFGTKNEGITH